MEVHYIVLCVKIKKYRMALSRVNTSAKDQLFASIQSTSIEKQTDDPTDPVYNNFLPHV